MASVWVGHDENCNRDLAFVRASAGTAFTVSYADQLAYVGLRGMIGMGFIGGTPFTDAELWAKARELVATHREGAGAVIAARIEAADAANDIVEHAMCCNLALGVLYLLRPERGRG